METTQNPYIFDFLYMNQDAKEHFGVFVRCLYKIAEINTKLIEAKELYEETKQTIYQTAAMTKNALDDHNMYELGVNQAEYFQQKSEYQTEKFAYENEILRIYDYFFNGNSLYEAYLNHFPEEVYQSFETEFISFLTHIECVDREYANDKRLLRKNNNFRFLFSRFRKRVQFAFLNQSAYIENGKLQIYHKPDKNTFYTITLWMIYEILEQRKIVQYNYSDDEIIVSEPQYRIKEHDFTNDEFFKKHYINVYGNLENSAIQCEHYVIKVNAFVRDIFYENKKYHIPMDYCPKCKQYFVDPETIDALRVSYHQSPRLRYNPEKGSMYSKNPRSTLSLYGYSVRKDLDLSPKQRRDIIDAVIENSVLTKPEVIDLIEMNITMREYQNTHHEAIAKWRSDLQYIRNRIVI